MAVIALLVPRPVLSSFSIFILHLSLSKLPFHFSSGLYSFLLRHRVSALFWPRQAFVSRVVRHSGHVLVPPTQPSGVAHCVSSPSATQLTASSLLTSSFSSLTCQNHNQANQQQTFRKVTERRTRTEFLRESHFSGLSRFCRLTDLPEGRVPGASPACDRPTQRCQRKRCKLSEILDDARFNFSLSFKQTFASSPNCFARRSLNAINGDQSSSPPTYGQL